MALGDLLPFRRGDKPKLFPQGIRESDATRERMAAAAELRAKLLDAQHTREMYGPGEIDGGDFKPDDLMPNPDELASRWGFQDIDKACDDMAGNVLQYGSFVEGRMDVGMSLELAWLPGVKGDPESERARDEVQACYEAIPERYTAERNTAGRAAERGFAGAELVWDLLTSGGAKGLIGIVSMIDRPQRMFGFDWKTQAPWFIPHGQGKDPQRIDDYKIAFARQGSLHTRRGSGYAQRCYPTVWMIDRLLKGHLAAVERWGWVPIIVTHPMSWSEGKRRQEHAILRSQWKNVLLVPGEVDAPKFSTLTDGAYANSNATGAARMALVKELTVALAMFVRGSMSTSGADTGSNAKEMTISEDRLWKAPADAAAHEAMWNRGLVEPFMLANHPEMDRAKWPRCSIDSSFGEDLALFLDACERGVKMGLPISWVTYSERTGIPLAQEGEPVLEAAATPAPLLPDGMAADEGIDPITGAVVRMSEPASYVIELADGRKARVRGSTPILTDKGVMMAKQIPGGGHVKLISAGGQRFA
jgi:hypothetical protein